MLRILVGKKWGNEKCLAIFQSTYLCFTWQVFNILHFENNLSTRQPQINILDKDLMFGYTACVHNAHFCYSCNYTIKIVLL